MPRLTQMERGILSEVIRREGPQAILSAMVQIFEKKSQHEQRNGRIDEANDYSAIAATIDMAIEELG